MVIFFIDTYGLYDSAIVWRMWELYANVRLHSHFIPPYFILVMQINSQASHPRISHFVLKLILTDLWLEVLLFAINMSEYVKSL